MRHGFSLVELSIVLVILGLLTGGILAGQSLIRAAELRAVGTEFQKYQTALYSFRDKYFALPGDMTNATAFWGKDNTNCPGDTGTTATPGTCNGNGDGTYVWSSEGLRAWQQLGSAGMVEGNYIGVAGTTANFIGSSVPRSKLSNAGHQIMSEAKTAEGWSGGDAASNVQFFRFGAIYGGADPPVRVGSFNLKPEEAWNIDTKMDDGKPGTGRVFAFSGNGCTDTNTVPSAVYILSATGLTCMLQYIF